MYLFYAAPVQFIRDQFGRLCFDEPPEHITHLVRRFRHDYKFFIFDLVYSIYGGRPPTHMPFFRLADILSFIRAICLARNW